MLFDQRVRVIADLGTHPWNYIAFNPQGRLVALGGFGNLAGKIDIFDRRTLNKVTTIDAPNTSHCEWSGDGRTLLTATLSPRLRVDNGIRIWHCSGRLLHVHLIDELYQVCYCYVGHAFAFWRDGFSSVFVVLFRRRLRGRQTPGFLRSLPNYPQLLLPPRASSPTKPLRNQRVRAINPIISLILLLLKSNSLFI